jgi:hypothetical protein
MGGGVRAEKKFGANLPFRAESPAAAELIKVVAERCDVSTLATRIRPRRLRLIIES